MILPIQKIPELVFGIEDRFERRLLNFLIEILKREGIGRLKENQKIEYSSEEMILLKKIWAFLFWFHNNECKNFRTKEETEELIKILIEGAKYDKTLQFFALFCPSYKKGKKIYGFNTEIGETTRRGIKNLVRISEKAESLGFLIHSKAIFSDLALENFENLTKKDFEDLQENFLRFKEYAQKIKPQMEIAKLSEIGDTKNVIGFKGITSGKINLSEERINQIVVRSLPFYKNILGWNIKKVRARTQDLSRSCPAMLKEIVLKNSNSLMVLTENNYERGRLYYAGIKPLPIFYPKKYDKLKIVIIGPPLSGKTTLASILSEKLELVNISAGKILEEYTKRKKIPFEKALDKPSFNDETLIKLIISKVKLSGKEGFILEGFPRHKEEFSLFEKYIKNIELLIIIDYDPKEILNRFNKRLICPKCNLSYNLKTNPPKINGECNFCKSVLKKREDDNLEMVTKRIEHYNQTKEIILEFLEKKAKRILKLPTTFGTNEINLDFIAQYV